MQPLNPYAPPQPTTAPLPQPAWTTPQLWRPPLYAFGRGHQLLVHRQARLPDVCIKCGTFHGVGRRHHTFTWTPPWALLTMLLGIGLLLLILVMQKTSVQQLPICGECHRRWSRATRWTWPLVLLSAAAFFVFAVLAGVLESTVLGVVAAGVLVTALAVCGVVHVKLIQPKTVWAQGIDDYYITVAGAHPNAIAAYDHAARVYSQQWQ